MRREKNLQSRANRQAQGDGEELVSGGAPTWVRTQQRQNANDSKHATQ